MDILAGDPGTSNNTTTSSGSSNISVTGSSISIPLGLALRRRTVSRPVRRRFVGVASFVFGQVRLPKILDDHPVLFARAAPVRTLVQF
jgi:hypothetical protein